MWKYCPIFEVCSWNLWFFVDVRYYLSGRAAACSASCPPNNVTVVAYLNNCLLGKEEECGKIDHRLGSAPMFLALAKSLNPQSSLKPVKHIPIHNILFAQDFQPFFSIPRIPSFPLLYPSFSSTGLTPSITPP